jgi:hypothetical protein
MDSMEQHCKGWIPSRVRGSRTKSDSVNSIFSPISKVSFVSSLSDPH